jgi:hypothetical protein
MVNTPMVANFGSTQGPHSDMVANAAAMKLSAMATVNNRIALDGDLRKYTRRSKSNDPAGLTQMGPGGPMPGMQQTKVVYLNDLGQMIQPMAAQNVNLGNHSRPNSPGFPMQGGFAPAMTFSMPQNQQYLTAYNATSPIPMGMGNGLAPVNMGQFGYGGHEGYVSDHSDMVRGRSPRGRRGSSKPPEDPADPSLLQDIPSWLRSLRLHKYTDNLKDMKWTDLIELDEKALEERGVNALGARRKMLKVFEQVKEAKADGKLG